VFEPSWEKLLIVLVIALIVLGPKKLPEVGRGLGSGIREFKDGVTGKDEEHHPQPLTAEPGQAMGMSPGDPATKQSHTP
jgi:sec-independent protein translocase protein TatA